MKSKIKTLALILIGATTAFTVSSCLGDSTDNYEAVSYTHLTLPTNREV